MASQITLATENLYIEFELCVSFFCSWIINLSDTHRLATSVNLHVYNLCFRMFMIQLLRNFIKFEVHETILLEVMAHFVSAIRIFVTSTFHFFNVLFPAVTILSLLPNFKTPWPPVYQLWRIPLLALIKAWWPWPLTSLIWNGTASYVRYHRQAANKILSFIVISFLIYKSSWHTKTDSDRLTLNMISNFDPL